MILSVMKGSGTCIRFWAKLASAKSKSCDALQMLTTCWFRA